MTKLFVLFLVLAFLFSCQKKETTPYDAAKEVNAGTITITINGTPWKGNGNSATYNINKVYFSISGDYYVGGYRKQSISITNIKPIEDVKQKLYSGLDSAGFITKYTEDSCDISLFLLDDDLVECIYYLSEKEGDNYVIIENIDKSKKEIEGRFSARLYTKEKPTQGFSDTLRITDGHFSLKYEDR
jgi:spore cortex formation protein SpoVR/YcgB (stage V sporulation)